MLGVVLGNMSHDLMKFKVLVVETRLTNSTIVSDSRQAILLNCFSGIKDCELIKEKKQSLITQCVRGPGWKNTTASSGWFHEVDFYVFLLDEEKNSMSSNDFQGQSNPKRLIQRWNPGLPLKFPETSEVADMTVDWAGVCSGSVHFSFPSSWPEHFSRRPTHVQHLNNLARALSLERNVQVYTSIEAEENQLFTLQEMRKPNQISPGHSPHCKFCVQGTSLGQQACRLTVEN